MAYPYNIQTIRIGQQDIAVCIPDPIVVKDQYEASRAIDPDLPFPFWSQIWPSAVGLASYLEEHPELVRDKEVVEIGGGLGLPSIVAASYAKEVCCTDYMEEAVSLVSSAAINNSLNNLSGKLYDWKDPLSLSENGIVLVSDVNYDPYDFDAIYQLFDSILEQDIRIILSTPQRLMARQFLTKLESQCIAKDMIEVERDGKRIPISIWILGKRSRI